jgi:hypothetical protein
LNKRLIRLACAAQGRFDAGLFAPEVVGVAQALVPATLALWKRVAARMLPTPAKFHYLFNMRELSKARPALCLSMHGLPPCCLIRRDWLHLGQGPSASHPSVPGQSLNLLGALCMAIDMMSSMRCAPSHARPQVFQGLILASRDRFMREAAAGGLPGGGAFGGAVTDSAGYLAALWTHECTRVFCDKMITLEDKAWVDGAIADLTRCCGWHACLQAPYCTMIKKDISMVR